MKLRITASKMLEALNIVNRVRGSRSLIPILDCVLMQGRGQRLILSRTNLTLEITTRIDLDYPWDSEKGLLAPADSLTKLFSRFSPDQEVDIEKSGEHLLIKTSYGQYKFSTMAADEFPRLRGHSPEHEFAVGPERFGQDVKKTAFCVSDDQSRPALQGICWRIAGESFMSATDGHVLSQTQRDDSPMLEETEVIVPVYSMMTAAQISENSKEFFVTFGDRHISFRSDSTEIASSLIEGPYPNVNQVIPRGSDKTVIMDRQPLIDAIQRLAISSDDLTHRLHCLIEDNHIMLSSEHSASGKTGNESIDCELAGEKIEIDFNLLYMLDVLKHIDTQKVQIELESFVSPTIFRPVNNTDYFYLLMPLRPDV